MAPVLLPGDIVPKSSLPALPNAKTILRLGPGIRQCTSSTIVATNAGQLCVDDRKKAAWVEGKAGRYIPTQGDQILAVVHHSSTDFYHCGITPYSSLALLPQLAFEGASRKSRPQLVPGSLVYARISLANKHMEPELDCTNPSTGKSDGLGELKGGMLFDVSLDTSRRLMLANPAEQGGLSLLDHIAEQIPFEMAVGRNGKVWIDGGGVKSTILIGKAIQQTDEEKLSKEEQVRLAKKLLLKG